MTNALIEELQAGPGSLSEHERGYREGIRASVTWLAQLASEMNDPAAITILHCACFWLGNDYQNWRRRIGKFPHSKPAFGRRHPIKARSL